MNKEAQIDAIMLLKGAMVELFREFSRQDRVWLADIDRLRLLLAAMDYVYAPEYAEMGVA